MDRRIDIPQSFPNELFAIPLQAYLVSVNCLLFLRIWGVVGEQM